MNSEVIPYEGSSHRGPKATTICTGRYRFHIGHVAEGENGRQEYQGPLVPGPWAYGFELCTVIDNHGGSARENAEAKAAGRYLDVADGDVISVAGHRYRVRFTSASGRDFELDLES